MIDFKVQISILRKPQNFTKSPPYFCPVKCDQKQGGGSQHFVAFSEYMNFIKLLYFSTSFPIIHTVFVKKKKDEYFAKFCGILRIYELYLQNFINFLWCPDNPIDQKKPEKFS